MASAVKVKVWARTIIVESKGNVWLSNIGYYLTWASLVGQTVKNLPVMQKTWVQSLGCEDPLEKEMATPSNVAWSSPWNSPG